MNKIIRVLTLVVALLVAIPVFSQKFAILSDIHVTPGNANEQQLKAAVAEINKSDVDVVVLTGDLTNEGSDAQLRNVKSILDSLTKPLYVIPGNHENTWSQSACKTFNDLWGADRFVFNIDSLVVVGMNCGPFMKMGDGHIKQEDLLWLDKTLAERVKPGMKVFSFNHYPINADLDNYRDYVKVLKKYPVITHLGGHYHAWKQYETDGIMGIVVRALDMHNHDYGYTLMDVDLKRDWIQVYNKRIGNEPELMYVYKPNLDYYDTPKPKFQNLVSAGFNVQKVYADNASIFTRLAVDSRNIYFGNSLGYCKAVDKASRQVRWGYKTDAMLFSRPVVGQKYVIVPTADKRLVWLNKTTGKMVWQYKAAGPYVADGIIADGILYQGGYKTFQAWNVDRHKLKWQYDSIGNYCQAEPVVKDGDVIFGAWDTRLRCLDKKTGRLEWSWSNGKSQNLLSPGNVVPVVTRDRVLIVAPDRAATAIDRKTGTQLWRETQARKVRESLGASEDGKVAYAKTMEGMLVAMSTEDSAFNLLWSVDLGMGYEHAPCPILVHNGYIYTGSRQGMLAIVDEKTHQVVVKYEMGSSEVNGFAVDPGTGDVYCSLIEGTIYKISR